MQVGILINIAETSSRPNTKQKLYVFGICASTPHLSQRVLCACMPQEHRDQCPGCPATLTADTVAEKFETDILPVDEEFNFHFGLNTTIRSSFSDDYRGLKEHVTGFVYDFKALGTLPVGPREMGAQWYAGARLGYSVFALFAWGASLPPAGRWLCFFTRIVEKPAELTIVLLRRCFELLKLSSTTCVRHWSDTGTHFRGYKILGTIGVQFVEDFKMDQQVRYGPEEHFKNPVDGEFSRVNYIIRDASMHSHLTEIPHLVRVCREDYDMRRASTSKEIPEEYYEEFRPPCHKSNVKTLTFKASSLPTRIKLCHAWDFTRSDKRRVRMLGTGDRKFEATGVFCRATMFDGCKCIAAQTCHPKVLSPGEGNDDIENEEPEHEHERAEVTHKTKEWQGWRLAYRTVEPEKHTTLSYSKKLRRKLNGFSKVMHQLPEGKKHKTWAEKKDAAMRKRDTALRARLGEQ